MNYLTLAAVAGIALTAAACAEHKPYPSVSYKTCPFNGIEIIDERECLTQGAIYNISPQIGQKVNMHAVDNRKTRIHNKTHYQCQHGGTNVHSHHGTVYHSSCHSK